MDTNGERSPIDWRQVRPRRRGQQQIAGLHDNAATRAHAIVGAWELPGVSARACKVRRR